MKNAILRMGQEYVLYIGLENIYINSKKILVRVRFIGQYNRYDSINKTVACVCVSNTEGGYHA